MTDQRDFDRSEPSSSIEPEAQRSIGGYAFGVVVVCLLVGVTIYLLASRPESIPEPTQQGVVEKKPESVEPEDRWQLGEYVGSQKCAECHSEIAEMFSGHPMANTLATVADASPIEVIEDVSTEFEAQGRQYRVERDGDRLIHTEFMTDEDGQVIYEQSEEVKYAVGSGMNARTYVIDHGGVMFESPITWYTEKSIWDLSPGYHENPAQRFNRRITDGCLQCHSGLPSPTGNGTSARFAKQPFLEQGIGCERCHGPGLRHVEKYEFEDGNPQGEDVEDMLIVNPDRLDGRERDSVCYQCHMGGKRRILRKGKSYHDFQPGMATEDIWTVFVSPTVDEEGPADFISHVEQMESSACFRGTEGSMRCTTCHDPHRSPAPDEKAAFYRERCLNCHADQGCSLPIEEREPAPILNSCIECHMPSSGSSDIPHTSASDHRILRNPDSTKEPVESPRSQGVWTIFDNSDQRMPQWEVKRAKALALSEQAMEESDQRLMGQAVVALEDVLAHDADDVDVLSNLGFFYCSTQNHAKAMQLLEAALQLDPYHELSLKNLGMKALQTGSLDTARHCFERYLEVNKWDGTIYGPYTSVLANTGHMQAAIEAAEQGLQLDPTQQKLRGFAAQLNARMGDQKKGQQHQRIFQEINKQLIPWQQDRRER